MFKMLSSLCAKNTFKMSTILFLILSTFFLDVLHGKYLFVNKVLRRDEAEFTCEKYGMMLPEVNSSANNQELLTYAKAAAGRADINIWLGLTHNRSQILAYSHFSWMDGSNPVYDNWNPGLSTTYLYTEYCARLDLTNGQWYSAPCIMTYRFVCQDTGKNPASPLSPIPGLTVASLAIWQVRTEPNNQTTGSASKRFGQVSSIPVGMAISTEHVSGVTYATDCLTVCVNNADCQYVLILDTDNQCTPHKDL